jgi:DUF3011 family protein
MQRRTTFLAMCAFTVTLALAGAPRAAAQTGTITCESKGSSRAQCAIDRGARVELTRHLSSTPCRENSNWGVGQGYIWVSGGCRAEFTVSNVSYGQGQGQGNAQANQNQLSACRSEADRRLPDYRYDQIQVQPVSRQGSIARVRWHAGTKSGLCTVSANGRVIAFTTGGADEADEGNYTSTGTRVICESKSGDREECRIPRGARVRLARQISQSPCRFNDTYGTGDGYLWVAKGCRGEFDVFRVAAEPLPQPQPAPGAVGGTPTRVTCQSVGNAQNQCPIPAGSTARLIKQLSPAPCKLNQTYGVASRYIWVNLGCGAEFEVR